jgi:hypothetical protein
MAKGRIDASNLLARGNQRDYAQGPAALNRSGRLCRPAKLTEQYLEPRVTLVVGWAR